MLPDAPSTSEVQMEDEPSRTAAQAALHRRSKWESTIVKSVLITGASGGFGMNTALALAEAGWKVFASMREAARGDALLAAAGELDCVERIRIVAFDVTDGAAVERAAA